MLVRKGGPVRSTLQPKHLRSGLGNPAVALVRQARQDAWLGKGERDKEMPGGEARRIGVAVRVQTGLGEDDSTARVGRRSATASLHAWNLAHLRTPLGAHR